VSEDDKELTATLRRGSDRSQLRDVPLDTEGRPMPWREAPHPASETRTIHSDGVRFDAPRVLSPVLPTEPVDRKRIPLYSGVLRYFPDALVAVAECSQDGNGQHNPGEPLHWAREKSADHHDCIARHLLDVGSRDERGIRHSARLAWRALAALQLEIEAERVAASNT
jgi:hypothetical protein